MSHSVHVQAPIPAQNLPTSGAFYGELLAGGARPTTTMEMFGFGWLEVVATSGGGDGAQLSGVDAA